MFGQIQYVIGTLKENLQFYYGPTTSPFMSFHYIWVKYGIDNKGNPTYKWNDARFLLANFYHIYIIWVWWTICFSCTSLTCVFLKWSKVIMKVVLGKEPKSHWVVVDTLDDYNDTSDVMFQLETLLEFIALDSSRALMCMIEFNKKRNFPSYSNLACHIGNGWCSII